LAAAALLALAFWWRDMISAVLAVAGPLGSFVLTEYVAKPIINEPAAAGARMYPSGHTAGVAAVAVTALVLLYRKRGWVAAALFSPIAVGSIVLVGLAVLRRSFHYPTDVVGGAALAVTAVAGFTVVLSLIFEVQTHEQGEARPGNRGWPGAEPQQAPPPGA
jgi:undecaprenyl-diphosphatase